MIKIKTQKLGLCSFLQKNGGKSKHFHKKCMNGTVGLSHMIYF